ncbi:MAG: T9SS type A sorting domain-containing protein [Saprospiraceae bacterium]|nr:T9SS type A sorting domain-containing protein [Saprospiraceae bacterium]
MKHILTLFVVCWFLPTLTFAQSSPMILQMDVEEVNGTDEIIAHLRVVQCDSILGFHMGLTWDTTKADFIQIEDKGPLYIDGWDGINFGPPFTDQGLFQSLWLPIPLECISLDSGVAIYSLRFKQLAANVEFTLLADTSTYFFTFNHKTHFETIDCNSELKDVIYINNLNDTLYVQNGGIVSQELAPEWHRLNIYPNPVQDILMIDGLKDMKGHWILNDLYGRSIKTGQFHQNPMQIQVNDLPEGWYFLQLHADQGQFTTRPILVQRN